MVTIERMSENRYVAAWRAEDKAHKITLMTLLLVGAGLRLYYLFQPIMHDEAVNYLYFAALPLKTGLSYYPYPNNHIFYTFLTHFTTKIFGTDPWAIRLPAFVAGILLIPAIYLVIRKLYNKTAGLIAAALVVPSSQMIAYSANGRGYTVQALIFLLLILAAIYVMRTNKWKGWIIFGALSALGFYTMPTMLYFFGAVFIWLLISGLVKDIKPERKPFLIRLAISGVETAVLTALLYVPVLIRSGLSSVTQNEWVKSLPWSSFIKGPSPNYPKGFLGILMSTWKTWNANIPFVFTLVLGIGFIVSLIVRNEKYRVNLALVILIWCFMLFFVQRVLPPVRTWLPLLPLYLGFASTGLVLIFEKSSAYVLSKTEEEDKVANIGSAVFPVVVVALVLVLSFAVLDRGTPFQPDDQVVFKDAKRVVAFLKPELKKGDIIYIESNLRKPFEYYMVKEHVPMKYLFMYPEDRFKKYVKLNRAFVVTSIKEGYTVEDSLSASNMKRGTTVNPKLIGWFPNMTMVFVINKPILEY